MMGETGDFGFVIDLKTQTVTFDGGFACPITNMLDRNGDNTLDPEEAEFIVVAVPPDGLHVTVDLVQLEQYGGAVTAFH